MNMFPHTVTLYNTETLYGDDLSETEVAHITLLRGVMLDETKGANVNKSGLTGADAVTLYIPHSVRAESADGKPKQFYEPQAFWALADKSGAWTLSTDGKGGKSFFVKGEVIAEASIALYHDNAWNITKVDNKDYGGAMAHWRVGGA